MKILNDDQEMFYGARTLLTPSAVLGMRSIISSTFNLFPQLCQDIMAAVEANDIAKAKASQDTLSSAVDAHTVEGDWAPTTKVGIEIVTGIKIGPPLLPQKPISAEAKKRIEGKLMNLNLVK